MNTDLVFKVGGRYYFEEGSTIWRGIMVLDGNMIIQSDLDRSLSVVNKGSYSHSKLRLAQKKVKKTRWINLYEKSNSSGLFETKEEAASRSMTVNSNKLIGTFPVEYEVLEDI